MVGKIIEVKVKVGDTVSEDDEIAILEAMKMEMPIPAPCDGTIKEVCVAAGDSVESGKVIAIIG
ncbi:MAG: acetyl-CoA carboxylase biotin carboxyl carrier protein subunit [Deltaproteobacteria bacterium]|nr:acetyl-CoA carboxylase biotin carboxyl carrier protein subunit [Deltaproteobacteria bacterium]MBW2305348.1 acetyl-CoA carboxylase biotin carboxyl carrier protein subunit [Deltaproteobacteria bacterium]